MLLYYLLFLPFLNIAIADSELYKKHIVYGVEGNVENVQRFIKQFSGVAIPYHEFSKSSAKLIIPPNLDKRFSEAVDRCNLTKEVLIEDYGEFIRQEHSNNMKRSNTPFSWTAYYDIDVIYDYLRSMSKAHDEAHLYVAGTSYEGRPILGLRINTSLKPKQRVVIESGIHAREWITPATTTYFINQLLTSIDLTMVSLKDRFEWYIFPVINPDGYHYTHTMDRLWRKTRSKTSDKLCIGIDLNRNWDYHWGQNDTSNDPCDETYGGPKPFSEPETASFSSFLESINTNLLAYIAFHSTAQVLSVPYSDTKEHVDNYDDLIKIGNTSLEYGEKVNGVPYKGLGTIEELFYPASGLSMDWVRNKLNTPLVYTYELRGSKLPFHWPEDRIPEQGDEVTRMLLGLFTEACNLGYCQF